MAVLHGCVAWLCCMGPRPGPGPSPGVGPGAAPVANVGETGAKPAGFPLVKFFTRHAILALAAYGMMVRLHFDPLGLLVGVSSLGIAVGVVALKDFRRRFQ